MKLITVDPRSIKVPEVRVTSRMSEETKELFRQSYRVMGNVTPILVCQVHGELWLVDGKNRLDEVIDQRIPELEVLVEEGDMTTVLCQNLLLDHLRGKHPVSEMVKVVEILWQKEGMDSDAIAKKTGLSRERVENYQLLSTLTPRCREELDSEKIGVGVGLQLVRISDPGKQEGYLFWFHLYSWDIATLKQMVDEYLRVMEAPPPPRTPAGPSAPVTIQCAYCREQYGLGEIANPATCRSCAGILYEAVALARAQMAEQPPPPSPEPPPPQQEPEIPPPGV